MEHVSVHNWCGPMRRIASLLLLALLVLLVAGCGGASSDDDSPAGGSGADTAAETAGCEDLGPKAQAALDAVVEAGAPGAIGFVRTGDTDACAAAGVSDTETETPMEPTDRWQIASVSKVFTYTVVLQLVGEGEISLDDTVEEWLQGLVPRGDEITVRMLLDHSSGLVSYADAPGYEQALADNDGVLTPRQLVGLGAGEPLAFEPGEGYEYSDTNTDVAGLIVEEATGQSLRTELTERIFDPLELGDTSFEPYSETTRSEAHGYQEGEDVTELGPTAVRGWADAAIVSNGPDLATFFSALLSGELLEPAELEVMLTPSENSGEDRGLTGLFVEEQDCEDAYGHEGHTPGFRTQVAASRDGSTVAVGFASTADDDEAIYDALSALTNELYCEE
jgi:D-alanyl-D-alanine carboxypeptidase